MFTRKDSEIRFTKMLKDGIVKSKEQGAACRQRQGMLLYLVCLGELKGRRNANASGSMKGECKGLRWPLIFRGSTLLFFEFR